MRYTNLIWDFDGMLFNTYPRMTAAFSRALKDYGVDVPYSDVMSRIKRSVGKACRDYAEAYALDVAALSERYHLHEHSMPPETMYPYDGMKELLNDAVRDGRKHFLYTHRDYTAFSALETHSLRHLFADAVTIDDGFPPKPAPDALLSLIQRNNLSPESCMMLGDRSIDIEAARNAGIAGCLFDPEHFYDDFATELRTDCIEALRQVLEL